MVVERASSDYRKVRPGVGPWARQTGIDGATLLALVMADGAPPVLRGLVAVKTMRQVWIQNFLVEHGPEGPCVGWRTNEQTPPLGRYIGSPYDPEARYATKGATVWSGYKVHLTETCDDGVPNLITNVETTNAAVSDDAVTSTIHTSLEARGLIPKIHVADTGFVNSALLVDARERFGIDLVGPTRGDRQWQVQAGAGFAARDFAIDFAHQRATCPAGKVAGDQDQVGGRRLPGVPAQIAVHALGLGASSDHGPYPSQTRSPASWTGATTNCKLHSRICPASWR